MVWASPQNWTAFVSTWRAGTAEARRDLAEEATGLARRIGDEDALTNALTVWAVVGFAMAVLAARRAQHVEVDDLRGDEHALTPV